MASKDRSGRLTGVPARARGRARRLGDVPAEDVEGALAARLASGDPERLISAPLSAPVSLALLQARASELARGLGHDLHRFRVEPWHPTRRAAAFCSRCGARCVLDVREREAVSGAAVRSPCSNPIGRVA